MALGVAAVVGRSPPCWPFAADGGPLVGLEQGRSWCLGGGRGM